MRNFISMRKAMSKEVGAGGRLEIFLDSDLQYDSRFYTKPLKQ